jgi:hypothetical protein
MRVLVGDEQHCQPEVVGDDPAVGVEQMLA